MLKNKLSTPVLFIIFNRPDTAQLVFNEIRKAKPKYLYVAADGPRDGNTKDQILCKETRAIIDQVDWECEVKTLFQDKNLGCKMGVSSAINWFFENVEAGIILEDDCVPHQSFFRFAGEMLEKYEDEEKVMMITGLNPISNYQSAYSYYFSRYFSIWGWATWKRAWQKYDITMHEWPQVRALSLSKYYPDSYAKAYMEQAFEMAYRGMINTWDTQWAFTCLTNDGLSIVPSKNLISNIGLFGVHTSGSVGISQNLPTFNLYEKHLVPPPSIGEGLDYDSIFYKKNFHPNLYNKIRGILVKSKLLKSLYHLARAILLKDRVPKNNYNIICENVNFAKNTKNCLLLYLTDPFTKPSLSLSHQNYWQTKELAKVLGEFGYNVDVIEYNNSKAKLTKNYDLIIDLHPGMNLVYKNHLNPGAKRVAYITGQNPTFSNQAEKDRIENIYKRRGVRLQPRRQAKLFKRQTLSSFDAMFFIGNEYNLRTYEGFKPPLVSFIINTGYDFLAEHDHSKRFPEAFLFLASNGQAHKGLDLLLEVFARNPQLQLYICSQFQNEADFSEVYKNELYGTSNIFPIGFIDIEGDEFKNIAKKCTYIIMPSCSEARAGSILTGMSAGLIPIVSRDCGFDDDEVIQLPNCDLDTIERTVLEYTEKPREWRENESERVQRIINDRYSKNNFSESVRKALRSLLKI